MAETRYDCIVIGSGPGGYVAAIRAAQLGMKTAVVEKDRVGGRCLNYACIPAKAVLRVADVLAEVQHAGSFGIKVEGASVDFAGVVKHREKVVKTLTGGVGGLFKKNKIDLIEGHASVTICTPCLAISREQALAISSSSSGRICGSASSSTISVPRRP